MKKIFNFITSSLTSIVYIIFATMHARAALLEKADTINQAVLDANTKANFNTGTSVATIAQFFIQAFLSLLGIIFLAMILYGGYIWMIAGGDESKVQKAKDTIWRAVIGIIIIVSAYGITYFVFNYLGGTGTSGPGF